MSEFAASAMSTWYLPTNQRISAVVSQPRSRDATKPAKAVSARLGSRYWGRTAKRSDKGASMRGVLERKNHSIEPPPRARAGSQGLPGRVARLGQRRGDRWPVFGGFQRHLFTGYIHVNLRAGIECLDRFGDGLDAVTAADGRDIEFHDISL